ncbi:MAG: FtsW/RodA/SpoVE family cell cycle protein [Chloroflexi bacterium]|nr:FtsW/RodA/SpoVE family cell cycle protein [Chloroflexota bacterium]
MSRQNERTQSFLQTLDKPLMAVSGLLLAIGLMMVYSTTFDWSYSEWGNPAQKVLEQARNVGVGLVGLAIVIVFDYRRIRRLSVVILLGTIAALIAVLLFGDDVFNARRSLIGGSLQPGELGRAGDDYLHGGVVEQQEHPRQKPDLRPAAIRRAAGHHQRACRLAAGHLDRRHYRGRQRRDVLPRRRRLDSDRRDRRHRRNYGPPGGVRRRAGLC